MELTQTQVIAHIGYLISIVLFVMGIKRLGKVKTATSANRLAASAMALAIICVFLEMGTVDYTLILTGMVTGSLIGAVLARTVKMTSMPEMVGLLNGFGGMASMLVGISLFWGADFSGSLAETVMQGKSGYPTAVSLVLSIVIGAVTLTGSMVAFLKLAEKISGRPVLLPARHVINIGLILSVVIMSSMWVGPWGGPDEAFILMWGIVAAGLLLGILLVIPIGGADMPVVISLLNSYSGMAACATGFALNSHVLIVSGALVGASGMILTQIMCKAMNRSLANVMFGGFGAVDQVAGGKDSGYTNVKNADPEEAALDFESAQEVIIVPGYGLAVAQGQNAVREFADLLKKQGCRVRYAIHPVAGRMPGHMNVLLAEANVPYDELYEMDSINNDFRNTDIALIIGANDVVNPAAKEDKTSPLYGMPVLNVEEARQVFVVKRSLGSGFAGVKNVLFEKDNCRMIYGDAKKVVEELIVNLEENNN